MKPGEPGPPREPELWRRDFPVDQADEQFVSRRDFTKYLVLVSCAFVVGQGWIGLQSVLRRRRGRPAERPVARLDAVPVGGATTFHYPDEQHPCLLLRPDAQTLVAYGSQCTHLMCAVRPQMAEGKLQCPCHAGYFDLASGRPLSGPPRRPLPQVTLEVRDGVVYATDVKVRTS